jgi:toluene monooxygenase system ferredoxin subunit
MYRKVLALAEIWEEDMHACDVDGCPVLLIRIGDVVYAYENRCAHLGLPLSDGYLHGCKLTCSGHHFEYDARTGAGISPKNRQLTVFPVRIEKGDVYVDTAPATVVDG